MFKNVPFIKDKEGSKKIVGRVVDVEGKEIDENCDTTNNESKSSSSVQSQKSTLSSSVSRIFGASPYKKASTTRTPGRKLLKKLICTPGKSRSFPDTSVTDIDDFGGFIPKINSTELILSRSTSSDEAKETSSFRASYSSQMPSSPPRLASQFLEGEEEYMDQMSKTKMTASTHHMSHERVDEALVEASNRSGVDDDMIFQTNSSSDDDTADYRNESEDNASIYSSPQQYERHSSPPKSDQFAMRSPGMSIPTPAIARQTSDDGFANGFSGSEPPFPHPLRGIHDSPMNEMNATTPNPKNLSTQFEEHDNEDAFLPNDFVNHSTSPKQDGGPFTLEQVERKIREAKRTERLHLRKQHEQAMEECQREFEKVMFDSGSQWKRDADEQEARYEKLLKDERHKTSLKHHELINKAQSLQDVKENMKEVEAERELLNRRVRDLENTEEKMATATFQKTELESLRKEKRNAENRISELESELQQGVDLLSREKEDSDQKASELSEQFRVLTESSEQSQSQLKQALEAVALLKGQLAETPSVDPEELRTSKLEIENLRNLRAEDEIEIQALQSQLGQIIEEHKDAITPKKKNQSRIESPCVGAIDMLRVDYDKAQEQLKSMGKVLKRYKTERDDLKENIDEIEERHVSAIEIAVKLATHDQKEKFQLLNEENEALRQKKQDIGEKMVEEMKSHMEDLKRNHEEEIKRLREYLDDQIKTAEDKQDTMRDEFEMDSNELKKNYEKKIESLIEEMNTIRSNQNDELSIAKTNSKEEIDSVQSELHQLKTKFENEKIELMKEKTAESEAFENQIKSMNEMHSEELELVAIESREEIDGLKKNINDLEMNLQTRSSDFKKMKSNFEDELTEAKAEKDRLMIQINFLREEKDAEIKKSSQFEAQIVKIQSENAARIENVREEYDRQIHDVKSEHASESDELLTQLDLIEAEAAQRFKNAESTVTEKDAVITALGSQLAESESRVASTSKEYETLKEEIEYLRSDLEVVTASYESSQKEIGALIERHEKEVADQIALRESACNEAREEMIALAEGQLAERQEYYQALKRELDNAQSKISVLERDLRFATKEMDEMGKRHDAREADLRDELAQSKAGMSFAFDALCMFIVFVYSYCLYYIC